MEAKEFETFRTFGSYELTSLKKDNVSVFNGIVEVEKYRVTIERIDEPKEAYRERLQKLWEECDNHHHWDPIRRKANELGVELTGSQGIKRKPKK